MTEGECYVAASWYGRPGRARLPRACIWRMGCAGPTSQDRCSGRRRPASRQVQPGKHNPRPLRQFPQVNQQMLMEKDNIESIKRDIQLTKEGIKGDQEASDVNKEPTWKPRKVVVNNYTTEYLDVYVNGNYKVQVQPGMQQTIIIEHRWNPTVLKAYGNEDVNTWGPQSIWGRFESYTWNIE